MRHINVGIFTTEPLELCVSSIPYETILLHLLKIVSTNEMPNKYNYAYVMYIDVCTYTINLCLLAVTLIDVMGNRCFTCTYYVFYKIQCNIFHAMT